MKFLLSRLQSPRVKNLSCEILIAWDLIKRYPFFKPCFSTEKRSIYVHFAHFFCCWSKAIYVGSTFSRKFHPREVSSFQFEQWSFYFLDCNPLELKIWVVRYWLHRDFIKRCTWWKQCKSVLTKMAWRKTRYLYVGIPYICHDRSRFHSKITSDWYIQSQNLLNFCYSFDQHHLPGMIRPSNSTINGCHFLSVLYLYMYSLTTQQKVKICIS